MAHGRPAVARTEKDLRERVVRMLGKPSEGRKILNQLSLFDSSTPKDHEYVNTPTASIPEFLGYICDVIPMGELYLFGGVLRDLALSGQKGFTSDIDLVVDGDWAHLVRYLMAVGFTRNRFGGFRRDVDGRPVDIWNSRETWAIREGLIHYRGIESLTKTTILNWDAILMNWRTRKIICHPDYFRQIKDGEMDVVLVENPNPLGAVVRAFRHLCLKDARVVTVQAARYLGEAAWTYPAETIIRSEIASYGRSIIEPAVLRHFRNMDTSTDGAVRLQFGGTSEILQPLLI